MQPVMKTNEYIDAQHQVVSNWNFIQFITRNSLLYIAAMAQMQTYN